MAQSEFIIKCRGLPWSCNEANLRDFFSEASRSITMIRLTKDRNGRPSGEAFVAFADREDYDLALTKDKDYIGKRYVELIPVSSSDAEFDDIARERRTIPTNLPNRDSLVLRLSGLPFGCTVDEIARFFEPIPIVQNGILIAYDHHSGRPKGEAYVAFPDNDAATQALAKNKEYIQHRYVDVFPSTYEAMIRAMNPEIENYGGGGRFWERDPRSRVLPYERPGRDYRGYRGDSDSRERRNEVWADRYHGSGGGNGFGDGYGGERSGGGPMRRGWREEPATDRRGYSPRQRYQSPSPDFCIRMRGLPYRATERDVIDFFHPLRPASIDMLYEYGTDRPSGEAIVEFRNRSDWESALERNRMYMGTRYIELMPDR